MNKHLDAWLLYS